MQLGYFQAIAEPVDLRLTYLGIAAAPVAPLSDEVVNSALAVLVAGVLPGDCLLSLDDQKL
jgi:hypothetical protein